MKTCVPLPAAVSWAVASSLLAAACSAGGQVPTDWPAMRASASVEIHLPEEFQGAEILPIATDGWEDGIAVSRDGLTLYSTYIPCDLLSFVNNEGERFSRLPDYDRGPHYGMDLETNPTGHGYQWYHSDIIIADRTSIEEPFSPWRLSKLTRPVTSEGGFTSLPGENGDIEISVITSNEKWREDMNFKVFRNTGADPEGPGVFLDETDPEGTSAVNTMYAEDNPHIERLEDDSLLLLFDSPDRPGGEGSHDIWYSRSRDDGANWDVPQPLREVNTEAQEHQPHLYHDGENWWLYYSAWRDEDGKLAIWRRRKTTADESDWDSWEPAELVISAGSTIGVGEPTLTAGGDLYFVAVLWNPDGPKTDRMDADAWAALRR